MSAAAGCLTLSGTVTVPVTVTHGRLTVGPLFKLCREPHRSLGHRDWHWQSPPKPMVPSESVVVLRVATNRSSHGKLPALKCGGHGIEPSGYRSCRGFTVLNPAYQNPDRRGRA